MLRMILKNEYQSPRGNIMPFRNNKGVHRQSFVRSILMALGISAQAILQDLWAQLPWGNVGHSTGGCLVWLQTSRKGLAGWENHARSLLLLAHLMSGTLPATYPPCSWRLCWVSGDPLVFPLCWDSSTAAELFAGALPHDPHPLLHTDRHKPLEHAWRIEQPSLLVFSLIPQCFLHSALPMNTVFSEMQSGLISRLLRGTCFPFSRHLAIASSNKKII